MFDLGILERPPTPLTGVDAQPLPHDPATILAEIAALDEYRDGLLARHDRLMIALARVHGIELVLGPRGGLDALIGGQAARAAPAARPDAREPSTS